MAGRVNLKVPPRLIESARAAQYASREAQGARELARRIESKVRQQRQAAKRAQPQAQTIDGQGAVFDAPALKRVPRIWRKRRPLVGGRYGVGWLHVGESYTVTSSQTASLELVITVGTGSGEIWRQARHTVNYSRSDFSSNFHALLQVNVFAAGQSDIVFVFLLTQFQYTFNETSFNATSTRQISFLITDDNIAELTHPVPIYAQRQINYWEANGPFPNLTYLTPFNISNTIGIDNFSLPGGQSSFYTAGLGSSFSSSIYETISTDGDWYQNYPPQQAKASYAAFSGNSEIPVMGYKRDDPSAARTPTTERGVFGIIPGASVTAPVTTEMRAAELEDEQVQEPGPIAESRTEPVEMIVAYDYHGGTYCRDQLARLGITLP